MERNEGVYSLHGTLVFLRVALTWREEVSEKLVFQNLKDPGLKLCFILILVNPGPVNFSGISFPVAAS